jgi:hypothetical protein
MKNLVIGFVLVLAAAVLIPSLGGGQTKALGSMPASSVRDDTDSVNFRLDLLEQVPTDTVIESNPSHPFLYTVPAGKSLIVTYFRAGVGGDTYTIGGAPVGAGAVNLGRIVVNEGETFVGGTTAGQTPVMCGYLVDKAKAPGVGVHVSGAAYVVPTGKTLYITHVVAGNNPTPPGQIDIDGKNLITLGSLLAGENVYIPVSAGKVVEATNTAAFHGYLK